MKKLVVALSLILGFSGVAKAGILVEPYLGYEMAKVTGTNADGKANGAEFGVRLAYKTPVMVWVGVDGTFGLTGKYSPDSGSDADSKHNTYYAVVGLDFPILLRAWAGYGFSDEMKLESPYNSKATGKNFKLGVGFTGLPFVSLNAEYIKGTADKIEAGGVTNNSPDLKTESFVISVSLPLVF